MNLPMYTIWYDLPDGSFDRAYADTTAGARRLVYELRAKKYQNIEIWLTHRIAIVTKDVMGEY